MSLKIKFIYFDLAGVQYNFQDGITRLVEQHKVSYSEFAKYAADAEEKANKGELQIEKLIDIYESILHTHIDESSFLDFWTSCFYPIHEVHELIKELSKQYKVGLLTNIFDGLLQKLFEKKLIVDIHYSSIVQSFQEHHVKPEKEIYSIAQKKADVRREEILFIDDKEINVQKARELGWQGVVFNKNDLQGSLNTITGYLTA